MFDKHLLFSPNPIVDRLMKIAISLLIICGFAPMKLDWAADIPITLQTLAILLPAIAFGGLTGGISTLIYLILIGFNLPLRPGFESGAEVLWGFHGGFYQGFLIASIAVGMLAQRWSAKIWLKQGALLLLGHIIILAAGLFWKWSLVSPEDPWLMLQELGRASMLKIAVGWLLLNIIRRLVDRDGKMR